MVQVTRKGRVSLYSIAMGQGRIIDLSGHSYVFSASEWDTTAMPPVEGDFVEFIAQDNYFDTHDSSKASKVKLICRANNVPLHLHVTTREEFLNVKNFVDTLLERGKTEPIKPVRSTNRNIPSPQQLQTVVVEQSLIIAPVTSRHRRPYSRILDDPIGARIQQLLRLMGLSPYHIGFGYLCQAVRIAYDGGKQIGCLSSKNGFALISELARIYATTQKEVKDGMRSVVEAMWVNQNTPLLREMYSKRPTNTCPILGEIITKVVEYLRGETEAWKREQELLEHLAWEKMRERRRRFQSLVRQLGDVPVDP